MLVPSIDIMGGKAVQLRHGRDKVLEREDVLKIAEEFGRVGEVAVIDLDAAMGRGDNANLVRSLVGTITCRVGGGVRSDQAALDLLDAGAAKVIVGTSATPELLSRLPRERVIVALDSIDGDVVVQGWTRGTGASVIDRMREMEPFCGGFLCTFVETEGTMQGIPLDRVRELRSATDLPLTVAGGVASVDEIAVLDREGVDVQVGMALYTGVMDPADAFAACVDFEKAGGLVPTVAQDAGGRVLMLAYSNPDTLKQAIRTGRATYWSRSRGRTWVKGVTSGNVQRLVRVYADCDRDALLFEVEQQGVACHTGAYSCFDSGPGGRKS